MAVANLNSKTAANVRSEAPNAVARLFNKLLKTGGSPQSDVFSMFEGPDGAAGFPVCRVTDLAKSAGNQVTFTIRGRLRGFGKLGDNTLRGNEEKMRFGTKDVYVDFIRHGSSWTRKMLRIMAAGGSVTAAIADELNDWAGLKLQTNSMHRLRQRATIGQNVLMPGNRGAIHALTSADYMSTTVIERAAALAGQIGAAPIRNRTKSKAGAPINKYMFFAPEQVLLPLKADSRYSAALVGAQTRGYGNNEQWDGGYADWDGNGIFHWVTVDEDTNEGPIGSMFDPRGKLGTAIAGGTTAVTITGGGTTSPSSVAIYWQDMPGYLYKHYDEESPSADTSDYYVIIWNHTESTGGAGDQGKWGFYRYVGSTGNTGNTIVTASYDGTLGGGRLGGTTNGGGADTRHTTVGSVTWDAAKNTVAHPTGAPVYMANKKGQIIGYVGCLGSNALIRAYGGGAQGDPGTSVAGTTTTSKGKNRASYSEQEDYGMAQSASIEMVSGVDVMTDTQGNPRNYVLVPTVYTPVGVNLG